MFLTPRYNMNYDGPYKYAVHPFFACFARMDCIITTTGAPT
jgi:hypothetical protein